MKRFHVMLRVENLQTSIAFYSALFGSAPIVLKNDYAKWLLSEPAVNFSIAETEGAYGIEHLGLQVTTEEDLAVLRVRAAAANGQRKEEGHTTCCYAKSDKSWVEDPQGVSWELFRTYGESDTYRAAAPADAHCCTSNVGQN